MISLSPKVAYQKAVKILKSGRFCMFHGSPGLGKSDIFRQIAAAYKLWLIDFRLAQSDPTDLHGFPGMNPDGVRMSYKPPEDFPLQLLDKIPEGFHGWLIVLDEINSAATAVQAAAYKLILDRAIGKYDLHDKVFMAGAGNLASDNAIVNRMSTAMQSRMVHLQLRADADDWGEWAAKNDIDHRVRAFIKFKPSALHKFDPKHSDMTYPCPRTWHMLSDIMKDTEEFDVGDKAIIQGTVGEGAGIEFTTYAEIYPKMATIDQMVRDPHNIAIPDEPSFQFAYASMLSHHISMSNCDQLMIVLKKLPIEFQVVSLKDVYLRSNVDEAIKSHPAIVDWRKENSTKLFD